MTQKTKAAVLVTALLCLDLVPGPSLGAQMVQGRVFDGSTERAVAGATVTLLTKEEERVRSAITDAAGAFEMRAPGEGIYRLRLERIGYPVHTTSGMALKENERMFVEVALEAEAIRLDPLVVVARGSERGREQFERRRSESQGGIFLDPIHIALQEAPQVTQLLHGVHEVRVDHRDRIHAHGGRCLLVFLDHFPLPVMATGVTPQMMMFGGAAHLNEVVSPRSVRGIEVYPRITDVPNEIRDGFRARDVDNCSVVLVWTDQGW